ncbi:hypothetical protein IWX47DRAFT_694412 [Phyllosticta citricarpa]
MYLTAFVPRRLLSLSCRLFRLSEPLPLSHPISLTSPTGTCTAHSHTAPQSTRPPCLILGNPHPPPLYKGKKKKKNNKKRKTHPVGLTGWSKVFGSPLKER